MEAGSNERLVGQQQVPLTHLHGEGPHGRRVDARALPLVGVVRHVVLDRELLPLVTGRPLNVHLLVQQHPVGLVHASVNLPRAAVTGGHVVGGGQLVLVHQLPVIVAEGPHDPRVGVVVAALEVPLGGQIVIEQLVGTLAARLLRVRVEGTTRVHQTILGAANKRHAAREGLRTAHLLLGRVHLHTNNSLTGRTGNRQRRGNDEGRSSLRGVGGVGGGSDLALRKTPLEDLHTVQEHTETHISVDRDTDAVVTSFGSEGGAEVTGHSGHGGELSRNGPGSRTSRPGSGGLGFVAVVPLGGDNRRNGNHLTSGVTIWKTEGANNPVISR